jgi:hypothetical protein
MSDLMLKLNKENVYENFDVSKYPENIHGWMTCPHVIDRIAVMKSKYLIEVGVWKGKSSIAYAETIKLLSLDKKVISIDTFLGSFEHIREYKNRPDHDLMKINGWPQIYNQFIANVMHKKLQDYIIPLPSTSTIASYLLKYYNIKSDLIYIDGDHTKWGIYNDLCHYYNLLEDGGIIYGDDWAWESVSSGVNKFCKDTGFGFKNDSIFWSIEWQGKSPIDPLKEIVCQNQQ